jgi:hypothetical protein
MPVTLGVCANSRADGKCVQRPSSVLRRLRASQTAEIQLTKVKW